MENHLKIKRMCRNRRALRIRKTVRGDANKPRLCVFRSNRHIEAQVIDDEARVTLLGIGTRSKEFKGGEFARRSKSAAREIGKRIAEEARKKKIERIVFDRGPYKYHGIIAELADGAREGGLKF